MKKFTAILCAAALMLSGAVLFPASAAAEAMPAGAVYTDPALSASSGTVEFTFGGKTYAGEVGVSVFKSVKDAVAAVKAGGELWLAPATYSESVTIEKNLTILGPKAGIDPNVRGKADTDPWTRSPDRGTGEAILTTSWHMGINATNNAVYDCHEITVDGLAVSGAGMFRSNYGQSGSITLNYKNMLVYGYTTANNGPFYCYSYYPDRSTNLYVRTVNAENIRFEGLTTAPGFNLTVDTFAAKGICFDADCTQKLVNYITVASATASKAPVSYTVEDCMFCQKNSSPIAADFRKSAGGHGFNATVEQKESVTFAVRNCRFVGNSESNLTVDDVIACQADTAVTFVKEGNTVVKAQAEVVEPVGPLVYDLQKELTWYGRTYEKNGEIFFNWSAAGFTFSFTGSGASAIIRSNAPGGGNNAFLKIFVDGKEMPDVELKKSSQTVTLASGLDASATHTVKVLKRTNARSSTASVAMVKLTDGKKEAPAARKAKLIEFVGDSLTVGYGSIAGNATAWSTGTEDVTKTYAPAIADAFDADYMVTAISGRGVCRNYGNTTELLLPAIYPNLDDYNNPNIKYNWEQHPDIVVVNLGTNDASGTVSGLSTADFEAGCVAFIKEIRSIHPDATIIWTYGLTTNGLIKNIQQAVKTAKAEGDDNVFFMRLSLCDGSGEQALGHPTEKGYAARAQSVIDFISTTLADRAAAATTEAVSPESEPATDPVAGTDAGTDAPETDPADGTDEPEPAAKKGCGSSVLSAAAGLCAAAAAAVLAKKKKEEDSSAQ